MSESGGPEFSVEYVTKIAASFEIIDGPKGTKKNPAVILSTIRPGYICLNDENGKSTVLRRAKVKTSKAK